MWTLALALATASPTTADLHVDASASCAAADGSSAAPFCTIGEALAAAASGDVVRVAPGTYVELLDLPTGSTTIVGSAGAEATILDAARAGLAVTVPAGADATIQGLTITNGDGAAAGVGAGAGITSYGRLTLDGCIVRDHRSEGPSSTVRAIALLHDSPDDLTLRGCEFADNTSLSAPLPLPAPAPPVLVLGGPDVLIEDCVFRRNGSWQSLGLVCDTGSVTVRRSTFTGGIDLPPDLGPLAVFYIPQPDAGPLRMEATTLHDNAGSAIIYNGSAGIELDGCTITGHRSAGGFIAGVDAILTEVRLRGTVLADSDGPVSRASLTRSLGHNHYAPDLVIEALRTDPTDLLVLVSSDPGLLPLADNGGSSPTRLPACDSPLRGAGPPAAQGTSDQRGVPRPAAGATIGAAEPDCQLLSTCTAAVNSTGAPGTIEQLGATSIGGSGLVLGIAHPPPGVFGFVVTSLDTDFVVQPGGSERNLCLGGAIGRLDEPGEIFRADANGRTEVAVDLGLLPQGGGAVSAQAGETWYFQGWHRDVVGGAPASNFTGAIGVTARN